MRSAQLFRRTLGEHNSSMSFKIGASPTNLAPSLSQGILGLKVIGNSTLNLSRRQWIP